MRPDSRFAAFEQPIPHRPVVCAGRFAFQGATNPSQLKSALAPRFVGEFFLCSACTGCPSRCAYDPEVWSVEQLGGHPELEQPRGSRCRNRWCERGPNEVPR